MATADKWRERAACIGTSPRVFFGVCNEPRSLVGPREQLAKSICASCPVVGECLEAVTQQEAHTITFGVQGGKTARERDTLRKNSRRAARAARRDRQKVA
jgi:WhiB family transcriptional regulator, redox-sensing transcriptional regulator